MFNHWRLVLFCLHAGHKAHRSLISGNISLMKAVGSGTKKRPHSGQTCNFTVVFQVCRMRLLPRSSILIALVGQISAHAPQPMQASECMSNGVPTLRSAPLPMKEMAAAPITSRQTRTHRPQSMHNSSDFSGGGAPKREKVTPSLSAISRITLDCGQRLRRNSSDILREATASGALVSTTIPSSTG